MRGWQATTIAALAALALGGCGLGVRLPTATHSAATAATAATGGGQASTTRPSAAPRVQTNELATPPGPDESAPAARSARLALERFASVYINWDAADVRHQLSQLATDSVGQARAAMRLESAQTGADSELRQAGIANHGTVEAVAPIAGADSRYVVITRETTTATDSSAYQGLTAAWHLTVATVTRRGAGWVISGWQPES